MSKIKKQVKPKTGDDTRKKINLRTLVSYNKEEDDHNFSTSSRDGVVTLKPQALKQKLLIATNILTECKEDKQRLMAGKYQDGLIEPLLKRLNNYTSLPTDELKQISDTIISRDRSFDKALKDVKTIHWPTLGLLNDDIRSILFKYIVEQKVFPSKIDVLKELKIVASKYSNETMPIHRLIKNKLIKYHHFPEFNRYLLTEHPEKVYHRTVYLKNMREFRVQGRNFVYVEVRRIVPRSTTSGFIAGLAAFPHLNKFDKFFTKDTADMIAKKWLQQRVLPNIPEGSVVVLSQPKKRNKVSPMGKKSYIVSWLEDNGIPYDPNAHTAELYSLYKRFKNKVRDLGVYDHVFLNVGFELIHCPVEWRNLNYFKEIWTGVEVMDAYHTGRPELLKQQILNAAQMFTEYEKAETSLIEAELKMYEEDAIMEEILENMFEMIKAGGVGVLDFPKECCADKTDRFETHVSDIVLDFIND